MTNRNTAQANQTDTCINIHPTAVKKWIEELPLGSTGESIKQIYHALKKVNQQKNSLAQHLEFLEAIAPTLSLLYPRLSQYFTDISLPLGTKTRNVIHVTTSLLNQILKGYQIILKKLITKKPFGWKKPFSLALHRSLIYTSQILCTQRLSYQSYSKGSWQQIFWCYKQAEKFKLFNKNYRNFSDTQNKTTIEYEFKKLLLLSLLPSNDLGKKNMQEVLNLMPLWIKHSEILTKEPAEKETCFTLNLLSDVPPYLVGTRNDKTKQTVDRHCFSTAKLKTLLTGYIKKVDENDFIKIGKHVLSKSTILSLLSNWTRNHLRTDVRKEGTGFVDIVTSITAIHFVLNQQNQPAYDEVSIDLPNNSIDFESTLTIEPINNPANGGTLNLDHFLSTSEQEEDVWGKVYENNINESIPEANWTESGIHKVFNFAKSILLDYSKGGYQLSVNVKTIDSLKHNELVAVREHALAPWALAQVKWLHFSEKGDVQFGLRILTHHVLPIHVSYNTNNSLSKPLPCLLGLDQQKLILFVPTLPTNLSGKKLQLEHQKQHSHISLENKILSTNAFDAYKILEPKINTNPENITQPEAIAKTNTPDEFSENIWDSF